MQKKTLLLISISMIASVFLHPVHAEESSTDIPYEDTLAEELGLEQKEESSLSQEISTAALFNDLIVTSYIAETSQNSRLVLEEISATLSNLKPDVLNQASREQVNLFMETIGSLRMPSLRNERLRFMRETSLARELKETVGDDPASLLKFSHSFELSDLLNIGLCRPWDSPESYTVYQNPSEALYAQEEPVLNTEKLSEAREALLTHLKDHVKAEEPYVLSMEAAKELAACRNSSDPAAKLQFLKDHQETYAEYPGYYALLAKTCFENKEYGQCLAAIETYEKKQGNLYEKDRVYARLIPYAIISLYKTVNVAVTRVKQAEPYIIRLIQNTDVQDWELRYFAAMAYMDIHRAADNPYKKEEYINNACTVIRSVVSYLVHEQRKMNNDYLSERMELKADPDASDEEKMEIRSLNTMLKEEYQSALPRISESLMLSTELLQGLAEASKINAEEIASLLYPDDTPLFLNVYLDQMYRKEAQEISVPEVTYDKKTVTVPVSHLNHDYSIKVTIDRGSDHWVFTDWLITDLKRGDPKDVNSYVAQLGSDINNMMKFEEDMDVVVEVIPTKTVTCEPVIVKYKTVIRKFLFFFKTIKLERID